MYVSDYKYLNEPTVVAIGSVTPVDNGKSVYCELLFVKSRVNEPVHTMTNKVDNMTMTVKLPDEYLNVAAHSLHAEVVLEVVR